MFKPPFGQTNTSTFGFTGAGNTNLFGQPSVFGKTVGTGFPPPSFGTTGSTNIFGAPLSSSGSLFGSSTNTSTFGQAQTTQPSFGFGTTAQQPTNLFGTQQNAGSSLFSSGTSSAFGANKPAFGSTFGTGTTGIFGTQQPTQTTSSLFGQTTPATGTSLFGSGTSTFGASNQQTGTVIKFNAVTGSDTMMKNGVSQAISTRHFCITCMKEYDNKSLEELRYEDYLANRKGPQQSNLFGAPTQQPSLFGATPNLFGSQPTENKPLFGTSTNTSLGFGTNTNVFGSTSTATSSLFNSKPAFGTATTTSSPAFGFGTPTSSSVFGAPQNKPFGTPAQGGIFGQMMNQPTTGFGNSSGFLGFGNQANQSIGLFQNKPTTPFTTGTTTTGFTFCSNPAANTSVFGAKPPTSGFGTTPGIGGFTGGFGSTNTFGTSTAQTNNLFKPATPNFAFGSSQNTGTLGTGSSLFGNTAQKPGIFGNTTGTGLFGSSFGTGTSSFGTGNIGLGNTSFGGGSLFGNTSTMQPQTNTSTTHPAILALASVPFADYPLFKNLLPATGKADSLLKPSNALTQKAMLVCKDLKVSPSNSVKTKLKPIATPLTKKSLFEGLEETEVVSPLFTTTSNVKKLVLKPKSFNNSGVVDNWTENNSKKENHSDKSVFRKSVGFADLPDGQYKEEESFYIRRNPLFKPQRNIGLVDLEQTSLVCNKENDVAEAHITQSEGNRSFGAHSSSTNLDDTAKDTSKQSSSLDETRGFLNDTSQLDVDWQPHPTRIINKRMDYYTLPPLDDLTNLVGEDGSCIVDNFCIGRYGYGNLYFEETMDVAGLNIDEIVHFRHKEVNVYPDDDKKPPVGKELNRKCQVTLEQVWPADKTTREPIKDPERLLKLKYEEKLRRSAAKMGATFIEYRPNTGSWVFKVDHFSKYGITDSDEEDQIADENKLGAVAGKTLTADPSKKPTPPAKAQQAPPTTKNKSPNSSVLSPILPAKQPCFPVQEPTGFHLGVAKDRSHEKSFPNAADIGLAIDDEIDEEDEADGDDLLEDLEAGRDHLTPTAHLARRIGIDSHRVQLMKASLFEQENDDFSEMGKFDAMNFMDYSTLDDFRDDNLESLKLSRGLHSLRTRFKNQILTKAFSSVFEQIQKGQNRDENVSFSEGLELRTNELPLVPPFIQYPPLLQPPRPKTVMLTNRRNILPLSKSCIGSDTVSRCMADNGIFKGRGFRNGWGPRSSVTSLTTFWRIHNSPDDGYSLEGRGVDDQSVSAIQKLHIYNKLSPKRFRESIAGHLMIQLEHSTKGEEDGCPIIAPQPGVDALHAHCLLVTNDDSESSDEFSMYNRQVWELCVALWGNLPTLSLEDEPASHKTLMMRREAITEWLKKGVSKSVQQEIENYLSDTKNPNRYVSAAFSSLSGREVAKACSQLQEKGDHFAALLLTSGQSSKILIQDQLADWENVNADSYIDDERLKLFTLSSGSPFFNSAKGVINTCENLDWKRAFAIHFWYILSSVSTIADVITKYETAFESEEAYARRPSPPYNEEVTTASGRHIHDICYNLLKLYCFKSHPLEQILNPATYSSDPLDYRLSWLLEKVLCSLGYVHVSPISSAITCVSFAAQLEAYGLWQWAVFVYLHLPDYYKRKQAVLDVIGRHVTVTEDRKLTSEEEFVVDEIGIPAEWVFRAKATRAMSQFRYHDATHYLIQAREWNEAHHVIIEYIAADAVINEHYDYLKELLQSLVPNCSAISEWFQLGQLLWDYLEVHRVVKQALAEQNVYELERRQNQISSICARIIRWPCKTVKDRLCQAEIAKRMAHIFRNVMLLDKRMSQSDVIEVISKLPLPEDYAMEELRLIKKAFPLN